MTEQQFWASFFHSHYVQRERLDFGSNEMFAECASIDEKEDEERKEARSGGFVPGGDVSNLQDAESGFFVAESVGDQSSSSKKTGKESSSKSMIVSNSASQTVKALIKRTNQYSSRFLVETSNTGSCEKKAAKRTNDEAITWEQCAVQAKQMKIDEMCRLDDLADTPEPELPKVSIQGGPEKFSQFGVDQTLLKFLPSSNKEVVEATNACAVQVQNWVAGSEGVLNTIGCLSLNPIQDFSQLSTSGDFPSSATCNEANCSSGDKIASELKSEMQITYAAANEVLSNFWQCFPIDSPEKEQKLERSYDSLQKFETSLLESFVNLSLSVSNANCANHLKIMIQQAHNKYQLFKNNKVRKK